MGFEKLTKQKRFRALTLAGGILLAWACTVADKGDYTFTDEPAPGGAGGEGGSGTGGTAGSAATGGSAASGGTSGSGGDAGEATGGSAGGGSTDPCNPNPCQHGECSVDGEAYNCDCETGWEGSRCQTNTDDCDPNPCLNGGACTDGVDEFTCDCTPGYSGTTCEVEPQDCDPNPCVHGQCIQATGGGFTCTCDPGWEGSNCATDINDCERNPCANGGRCTDRTNAFVCECTTGWTGTTCTMDVDECPGTPCRNGGTCTNTAGSFTCACPSGWDPPTCTSGTITLGYLDAGFWDDVNGHVATSLNTYTGTAYYTEDYNSFFVFSIPTFEGSVTGVRVALFQDGYWSNDSFETVSVYGFTGSITTLRNGGSANPAVFSDLGNAPLYAQFNAPRGTGMLHSDVMNATAFGPVAAARGSQFAFGLHVETITGSSYEESLRFGTPPPATCQLFITVSP